MHGGNNANTTYSQAVFFMATGTRKLPMRSVADAIILVYTCVPLFLISIVLTYAGTVI